MLRIFTAIFILLIHGVVNAQSTALSVSEKPSAFPLFSPSYTANIYVDDNDAKVVTIAATAFANDVQLISGKQIPVLHINSSVGFAVIAGTIGNSKLIDDLITSKQIDVSAIKCFI